MISRPLAVGLLAAGCLTAAAGGAYVAVRSNRADNAVAIQQTAATPTPVSQSQPSQPVAETEGVVAPGSPAAVPQPEAAPAPAAERLSAEAPVRPRAADGQRRADAPRNTRPPSAAAARTPAVTSQGPSAQSTPPVERPAGIDPGTSASPTAAEAPVPERARASEPPPAPVKQYQQVVVPASSVISLQVQAPVSSEQARVEDRVEARVTRDVMADNSVAIPSGSRVLGTVMAVDRGGKIKERARLDVRFHTLVLADGTEIPMRTETVSRFGESPTGESARKIGGAAVGGAILGAIIGGGKGAAIGGATGAAGGTAVVMAGDRNAATLPAGTILSVRLANPVTIDVAK